MDGMNGAASELTSEESLVPKFGLDFSLPKERLGKVISETTESTEQLSSSVLQVFEKKAENLVPS